MRDQTLERITSTLEEEQRRKLAASGRSMGLEAALDLAIEPVSR